MHMRKLILLTMISICSMYVGNAQHIRVRLDFPGGASVRPLGNAPYRGAVWIGPEWRVAFAVAREVGSGRLSSSDSPKDIRSRL